MLEIAQPNTVEIYIYIYISKHTLHTKKTAFVSDTGLVLSFVTTSEINLIATLIKVLNMNIFQRKTRKSNFPNIVCELHF